LAQIQASEDSHGRSGQKEEKSIHRQSGSG